MEELSITSMAEFTAFIFERSKVGTSWFRGVRSAGYDLSPSLYRHPTVTGSDGYAKLEKDLITTFRHRSLPFVPAIPTGDLELLFLMQHHGMPTRLLDWTENPFVALFFALEACRDPAQSNVDSVIWALDPLSLNKFSLSSFGHAGILSVGDDLLNGYEPVKNVVRASGSHPVALYGVHNSQRIVAQRGVFVLFGTSVSPLNKIVFTGHATGPLIKAIIPAAYKRAIFKQLFDMGITDSVIFPDLDGLAREIKTRYEF